jgi:HD-GYP domain-containing protein (c-di-GMP phosphodiesterase class II)
MLKLISNEKIVDIMEKTLNHVDARLTDHGKRVAYLIFKVLEPRHDFTDKELRDICILAMLHDVGAYKTEEIDKMVVFETKDVWEHSIYGCLFLQYFSPLRELAPVLLFHHAECDELADLKNPAHQVLSQLISLCDRADVFALYKGSAADFRNHLEKNRDIKYRGDIVDMFLASGVNIENVFGEIDSDESFRHILYDTPMSGEEVSQYIRMIIFSIDFRSSQTVIHTVATTCIAGFLAGLSGADENAIETIKTGAMLHDIGKIGIPVHILENPGKLSDSDMEIMRTHVDITDKIITGSVHDVVRHIAVGHHEKLDGSGYPNHLNSHDIAFFDQIVAIADIFSALCGARSYKEAFPKERIVKILSDMSAQTLLDPAIVTLAVEHFDEIMEAVDRESRPIIEAYNAMNEEYLRIKAEIKSKYKTRLFSPM